MMPGGWERLAGHEGGTVVALAVAPGDGAATLLAATTVGLFRSGDGGRSWSPAGETPLPLLAAIAPSARFAANRTLFAGAQTGLHRSTDGGRTWRQTLSEGRVFAIAVVPGDGAGEVVFIGTEKDGILRSDDSGLTWAGANPGLLDFTVLALAFSPDAARDLTGFAATASGLYRTRNGGKSWREVELPLDEPAVQCVALSPAFARDRLVLAGTEGDGLWRSDDGGMTWDRVPGLPDGGVGAIAFSAHDADSRLIAVATDGGVALSNDGGATWQMTGEELPPALALAFVPDDADETLVAGLHRGGIVRRAMTGHDDRWLPANTGLTATFLSGLVSSPSFSRDRTLVVWGPEAGIRVSRHGGATWAEGGPGEVAVNGVAFAGSDTLLFAATDAGIFRSRDAGATWDAPAPGSDAEASAGIVVAGRAAGGGRMSVMAATGDGRVIASDDGERWRSLGPPADGATVVSLACASDGALYIGTTPPVASADAGVTLWRSTDGGATWTPWLEERGAVGILPLAIPEGDDAPIVGLGARVLRPRRNAWQTRDGARTPLWRGTALPAESGSTVTITALATSPQYRDDGTLFAATSVGVYHSRDRGRTFAPWNEGMAAAPILALAAETTASDATGDATLVLFALGVDGTIWRRISDT